MPDPGLLVLDNKEQVNFGRELIDFCLFLATGAARGRSTAEGKIRIYSARPVAVITSIEGVTKHELAKRCVEVEYVPSDIKLPRRKLENEITARRADILTALLRVLQEYLRISTETRLLPNPIPDFQEHFTALCHLLIAYGQIAGKAAGWADSIIRDWNTIISSPEETEHELAHLLLEVIKRNGVEIPSIRLKRGGRSGTLYITTAEPLLSYLQKANAVARLPLPQDGKGLSRRLKSGKSSKFEVLDQDRAPEIPELKRSASRRPLGIFIPK
jgi:hypothetical protein